jgi:hypothetical protein
MNTSKSINPVVAGVIAVVVAVLVGLLALRIFGSGGPSSASFKLKPANPNAPQYRPDPKLAGGQ